MLLKPCPYGTAQIVKRCVALQVDVGIPGLLRIKRRAEEYRRSIVAAEVAGQHAGRTEPGSRVAYQEGRVFFTPLRSYADVGRQVNDRGPASGDCEQIGSNFEMFRSYRGPDGDTCAMPLLHWFRKQCREQ